MCISFVTKDYIILYMYIHIQYACHVLNNGIISFGKPPEFFYGSGPFPLPRYVLIAPFYGDVDTRNGGETWFAKRSRIVITAACSAAYYSKHIQ